MENRKGLRTDAFLASSKGEWAETGEYIYDFANKGYVRTKTGEYMTWRTEEVDGLKQENLLPCEMETGETVSIRKDLNEGVRKRLREGFVCRDALVFKNWPTLKSAQLRLDLMTPV